MINVPMLVDWVHLRLRARFDNDFLNSERGEGVISAAIAVLVMAFLGAAMWVAFNAIFTDATNTVGEQVQQIGGG